MPRDRVFALPMNKIGRFTFDEEVVKVFPDMISRSVPGYASVLSMIRVLGSKYVQPASNAYDLGCSLGAGTKLLQEVAPSTSTIFAIDNSEAMIAGLKQANEFESEGLATVIPVLADLREVSLERAAFVMLNWTLQFVPVDERDELIAKIYDAMLPQGALMMSEKIVSDNPAERELLIDLHHEFKSSNGYSQLEIAQKRNALENSLIPESVAAHKERLLNAGFDSVIVWFQCFNFASWLAIKS